MVFLLLFKTNSVYHVDFYVFYNFYHIKRKEIDGNNLYWTLSTILSVKFWNGAYCKWFIYNQISIKGKR